MGKPVYFTLRIAVSAFFQPILWQIALLGARVLVAQIPQHDAVKVGIDDYLVRGGRVSELEVVSLGHRLFKSIAHWHGRWKFQKALMAA